MLRGYEFKRMHVLSELAVDELNSVPMLFYNVEADAAHAIRGDLFQQLGRMRKAVEDRLLDLCYASQEIIRNHEAQALNAAIEEVTSSLNTFLEGNRELGAREQLAYVNAIRTIEGVRYASTLWASARRSGDYTGLNVVHLVGVGAARDAKLRSESWFNGLDAFLNSLKADGGLALANRSIDQIAASATASKRAFLEAAQLWGMEVYRGPLSRSPVWSDCVSEWGRGPGFKLRVAQHLRNWFEGKEKLKARLEKTVNGLWEEKVIAPLMKLVEENA